MIARNTDIGVFIIVTTSLILLLIGFIILILFLYKRKQLNFYESLEAIKNDHEKTMLTTQLEIQEQTLKQVSGEIHDNIGLSMSMAKLNLMTIYTDRGADISQKIAGSIDQLRKAIDDLRHISKMLDTDYIADSGLDQSLVQEIEHINQLNIFDARLEITGKGNLSSEAEVNVFRIIQEALNNCIKHAHATQLYIGLQYTPTHLYVQVADNGMGMAAGQQDKTPANGIGIKNMELRAQLLKGSCSIDNNTPKGTVVRLTIPINATHQKTAP